jgi:formylglycine-generating enzyme required for sulfatase activity
VERWLRSPWILAVAAPAVAVSPLAGALLSISGCGARTELTTFDVEGASGSGRVGGGVSGQGAGGNDTNPSGASVASGGNITGATGGTGQSASGQAGQGATGASEVGGAGEAGIDGSGASAGVTSSSASVAAGSDTSVGASPVVPGGTFYRNYDGAMYAQMDGQATVSTLRIDRFEITVGRFREFVTKTTQGEWLPAPGSGKHSHLNGGQGLVDFPATPPPSYEPGWQSAWNANLATTEAQWDAKLTCGPQATWTSSPGLDENRPINCIDWYEAYAFCIWDGGFLPSDAEWNYVASGGSEQRVFPWSAPPMSSAIDCTHANYSGLGGGYCAPGGTNDVGSESPEGDGKWGQSDLAGNVSEWVLDVGSGGPCVDCLDTLQLPRGPETPLLDDARMIRGGALGAAFSLEVAAINDDDATDRNVQQGARCARVP